MQLVAEMVDLIDRQTPLKERAGVDARRDMALEVDQVALVIRPVAAEEMVVADLVECRRRRIAGDMPADALFRAIGLHHHRHRVPADDAADTVFHLQIPRIGRLRVWRDSVDVGRVGGERQPHPL